MKSVTINLVCFLFILCYTPAITSVLEFTNDYGKRTCYSDDDGYLGECTPEFRCNSSQRGLDTFNYCQKYGSFKMVCCHLMSNAKPVTEFPKLQYPNCGERPNSAPAGYSLDRMKRTPPISRIVLNKVISEKESWPWMAAIYERGWKSLEFVCGGTLINDRYVVTGAQCVKTTRYGRINPRDLFVRLREYDTEDDDTGDQYQVEKVIVHEGYVPLVPYNDIALLKLSKKVRIYDKVKPVCLPINVAKDFGFENIYSTVLGWGASYSGGKSSDLLREASIPITTNRDCDKSYKRLKNYYSDGIISSQLCAGAKEGGKDACHGDGGGPLLVKLNGKFTLVGIVSGGYRCGSPDFPGVYTRVTSYLNWINKNID